MRGPIHGFPRRVMPRLLAVALTGLFALLWATPANAATTFTQLSLTATVSGTSVTASASIRDSTATAVDVYGICVRDVNGRIADFPGKKPVTISTGGTPFTATRSFAAGTFTYYPCVLVGGKWSSVGKKTFTVTGGSTPAVLFSDDFSGSSGTKPDASRWTEWSACTYNGSAAYGKIGCGSRAALDGQGHLSIPSTPTQGTSISTKDHFTFTYGTMTARMKIPTEPGYWPAFWALNNNPNGTDASVIGEIDAHESYTGLADYYHIATHHYSAQSWSGVQDPACGRDQVFGEWHDYSAKVEPGRVSFSFDGRLCGTYATSDEAAGRPYAFGPETTRGLWPILTLAVGGAGGQQDGKATQPAALLVDSVTVTAL